MSFSLDNFFSLVKSSEKVFAKAEEQNLLGDEEQAYILYMKYFNIITAVKKTAEFKKNEVTKLQ